MHPPSLKPNRGQFRRGPDPRRHRFTRDECQRGFWAAIYSIIARYPDAIGADGRHIAFQFLDFKTNSRKEKQQ